MDSVIADTNAIAGAILKDGLSRKIIMLGACDFYAPDFLKEELVEHEDEFLTKSKLPKNNYRIVIQIILENITCIPEQKYIAFKKDALVLTPDEDDWPFFAAALYLKCPIWSNDKLLKGQKKVNIYNTGEIGRLLLPDGD